MFHSCQYACCAALKYSTSLTREVKHKNQNKTKIEKKCLSNSPFIHFSQCARCKASSCVCVCSTFCVLCALTDAGPSLAINIVKNKMNQKKNFFRRRNSTQTTASTMFTGSAVELLLFGGCSFAVAGISCANTLWATARETKQNISVNACQSMCSAYRLTLVFESRAVRFASTNCLRVCVCE